MEKIYVDENGFYEIKENELFDLPLPVKRDNEDFEEFSNRTSDFIKSEYGDNINDVFTTGNTFLRRQVWLTTDKNIDEACEELDKILTEADAIVDALQRNGFIGYDRNYDTDDIVKIPTRNEGESIEEFHNRLDQFHYDHMEGNLDDSHRREYNVYLF